MEMTKQKTIGEIMVEYFEATTDGVATLRQLYAAVKEQWTRDSKTLEESIRATIYHDKKKRFKRIGKGLYLLVGKNSSSLLINGDSRKMEEIDDESIDTIITDHPWSDPKAHKSGNQKGFAEYETFVYTLEDFKAKARVLKPGAFLTEFLPVESATNWEYIAEIKKMAKEAGFKYYASMIWRKAPEGTINNGRTTKGVEQVLIFSKGNPRRIAPKGKPYMTRNMLSYEIDIPIKANEKNHQAEKPIALYEYLIENLTDEQEICLDQFGGACNMLKAALNKNRFAIVYELGKQFVENAVKRFGCLKLYESIEEQKIVDECMLEKDCAIELNELEINQDKENVSVLKIYPAEATAFQLDYLKKVWKVKPEWFESKSITSLDNCGPEEIDSIFNQINEIGYSLYKKPAFDIDISQYLVLEKIYAEIKENYEMTYEPFTRSYYQNVKIEQECYAEYLVTKKHVFEFKLDYLEEYLEYLKSNWPLVNVERTRKILGTITI